MRWLVLALVLTMSAHAESLAWEIPYGIQDPMHSPGYPACDGGEIGYWQVVPSVSSDGKRRNVFLALFTVDIADPAFLICFVPSDRTILVMEPGKKL